MCFQRDHDPSEALPLLDPARSHGTDIVGIGLDSYEKPGFPALFQSVYDQAKKQGLRLTSHCDVNQGRSVEHIRSCIKGLGVERIDHGLNAIDDPALLGSGWLANTMLSAMQAAPFTRAEIVQFAENAVDSAWIEQSYKDELSIELDTFCTGGDPVQP